MKVSTLCITGMTAVLVEASRLDHKDTINGSPETQKETIRSQMIAQDHLLQCLV